MGLFLYFISLFLHMQDNQIYNTFKKIVRMKGFTLKDFAKKIGMTEDGLRNAIINKSLKIKTLIEIRDILDIQTDFFFGIETANIPIMNEPICKYNFNEKDGIIKDLKDIIELQKALIKNYQEQIEKKEVSALGKKKNNDTGAL